MQGDIAGGFSATDQLPISDITFANIAAAADVYTLVVSQPVIVRERPVPDDLNFGSGTPPMLQRLYGARGVFSEQQLGRQLRELPAPELLAGIDAAVALLATALEQQWAIMIVGDFDADGATSTALAVLALGAMGFTRVDYLVPNRFDYGYGLTPEIVTLAAASDPDLIITVDNGISSIAGVNTARDLGIRVLITDHHLPGPFLPAADAIVNPNQPGCPFPAKSLAGVGVVFYLMSALRARLRAEGRFGAGVQEPNMATWLDLVALGTVADVVPLDRTNRVLVHQGLLRIRSKRTRPGILALLDVAGKEASRLVSSDLGFALGPRLNAAGRLDDMRIGIQCLLADDDYLARELAVELDQLNRDRKAIESGMQQEALTLVKQLDLGSEQALPWGICLFDPSWHQGVVGLLASRIKDRVHRPVIAFARGDNGELKGSARSIRALHIRDALDAVAARHPGLVTKFGGHAMAAGLSLGETDFPVFLRAFDDEVRRQLSPQDLEQEILVDVDMGPDMLNLDSARIIRDAGPWGQHFPEPLFRGQFAILDQRRVGQQHLKLSLAPTTGGEALDAIAFNVEGDWPNPSARHLHLLYRLDVNHWRGREAPQLLVERILAIS